jgi:hypothetical protein
MTIRNWDARTIDNPLKLSADDVLTLLLSLDDDDAIDIVIEYLDRKTRVAKAVGDHLIAWPVQS